MINKFDQFLVDDLYLDSLGLIHFLCFAQLSFEFVALEILYCNAIKED